MGWVSRWWLMRDGRARGGVGGAIWVECRAGWRGVGWIGAGWVGVGWGEVGLIFKRCERHPAPRTLPGHPRPWTVPTQIPTRLSSFHRHKSVPDSHACPGLPSAYRTSNTRMSLSDSGVPDDDSDVRTARSGAANTAKRLLEAPPWPLAWRQRIATRRTGVSRGCQHLRSRGR